MEWKDETVRMNGKQNAFGRRFCAKRLALLREAWEFMLEGNVRYCRFMPYDPSIQLFGRYFPGRPAVGNAPERAFPVRRWVCFGNAGTDPF